MSELPSLELAEAIVSRALANGGDFAELFAERTTGMSITIDESRIEGVQSGGEQGAGVRVVKDGTAYFAHVDGLGEADLQRAADEAAAFMRRRRHVRRHFARVYRADGSSVDHPAESETGAALFAAAGSLIELPAARPER